MSGSITRRAFLAGSAAFVDGLSRTMRARADPAKTRLILLGTGGGPRPRQASAQAAQVIVRNGIAYVIDCGNGIARQLVFAGVPLASLRHVFITHHHSDHNADYGTLLSLAWSSGLHTRVDSWGPPPLERITRLYFEMNAADLDARIASEGREPLAPLVHPHEVRKGGLVMRDDQMRVRAAIVRHLPFKVALAYRFDTADRSIVISGDTARSQNLQQLAIGADVLVHSALYLPAMEQLRSRVGGAASNDHPISEGLSSVEDAARLAEAARVKTLVLSHLIPADDPTVTEQMWIDAARPHYRGTIVVARDLLEV